MKKLMFPESADSLCRAYSAYEQQEPLYERNLFAEALFSLRRFQLPQDGRRLIKWLKKRMPLVFHRMEASMPYFMDVYGNIAASRFAQALIGSIDNKPAWLIDLSKGPYSHLNATEVMQEGVYVIQMYYSPQIRYTSHLFSELMYFSLDYLFQFPRVEKIYLSLPEEDTQLCNRITEIGFREVDILDNDWYKRKVFRYCRNEHIITIKEELALYSMA